MSKEPKPQRAKRGQGAGILLLALLAFALVGFPGKNSEGPRAQSPKSLKGSQGHGVVTYHILRFWGLKPHASRAVLEHEAQRAAKKHGLNPRLFKALVRVESAWNPKAISRVGARGLSQIMPANARRCGLPHPDALWDVTTNLSCGARILSEELETHGGDLQKALQAYNGGPRCINRCKESIQYAKSVLSLASQG